MFARILMTVLAAVALVLSVPGVAQEEDHEFRQYVLSYAEIGGLPFDAALFTSMVKEELATTRLDHQRLYPEVEAMVEEMAYQAVLNGLDLETVLAIGWQESKFRPWVTSPGGEFCGPFQQGARYSMAAPMRRGEGRCVDTPACRDECRRLRFDVYYAVERLVAYLNQIDRYTGGHHREQVCRYQGGVYGACGPAARAYAERHVAYREHMIALYREHYERRVRQQALTWATARNYSTPFWDVR